MKQQLISPPILGLLLVCLLLGTRMQAQTDYTLKQNWHEVERPRIGYTSTTQVDQARSQGQVTRFKEYVDGNGKTVQQTSVAASGYDGKDVTQLYRFEPGGSTIKQYLPYKSTTSNGEFQQGATTVQGNFYKTPPPGMEATLYPYVQNDLERSQRSLPKSKTEAGNAYRVNGLKSQSITYRPNRTNEVNRLIYNAVLGKHIWTSFWPTGTLLLQEYTDENGDISRTWTDLNDRVVLTERLMEQSGNPYMGKTFYGHDMMGNVMLIIPPQGSKVFLDDKTETFDDAFLAKYCFQYKYDGLQRQVESQAPGEAPVYKIYDPKGRLVLSQDGNQRIKNGWQFTKFDALDRVAWTGILYHSTAFTRTQMQEICYNFYGATNAFYDEERSNSAAYQYYSNRSFPVLNTYKFLQAYYYDDYDLNRDGTPDYVDTYLAGFVVPTKETKGLATITRTGENLDENNKLVPRTDVVFYDGLGNVVQQQITKAPYNEQVWTKYNFNQQVTENLRQFLQGTTTLKLKDVYAYDNQGRMTSHTLQWNNEIPQILSKYDYDALGELKGTLLEVAANGTWAQAIVQERNLQNQVTKISTKPKVPSDVVPAFSLNYAYHNQMTGQTLHKPRFANDVTAFYWSTPSNVAARGYLYQYENGGRLKSADYGAVLTTTTPLNQQYAMPMITYDANGNITRLTRKGPKAIGSTEFVLIDQLDYKYLGNQLISVVDGTLRETGNGLDFKGSRSQAMPGQTATYGYMHDANGNVSEDRNKGLTIGYDVLGLPTNITRYDGAKMVVTYDGAGNKIHVFSQTATNITKVDYFQDYVIENDKLVAVRIPEGQVRITPTGRDTEYFVRDDQGTKWGSFIVRNGAVAGYTETAYYPFGLEHVARPAPVLADQLARYNGQDNVNEINQQWIDFGFRQYDPQLGRWLGSGSVASKYAGESPYSFLHNAPLNQQIGQSVGIGSRQFKQ